MPTGGKSTGPDRRAPGTLVRAGRIALVLLVASAGYLIWARGEAILADLAGLAAWCF